MKLFLICITGDRVRADSDQYTPLFQEEASPKSAAAAQKKLQK